jgi:hypothetical protein
MIVYFKAGQHEQTLYWLASAFGLKSPCFRVSLSKLQKAQNLLFTSS